MNFVGKLRKPPSGSIAQRRGPQGQSRGAQMGIELGKTTQRRGVRHRRSQRCGANLDNLSSCPKAAASVTDVRNAATLILNMLSSWLKAAALITVMLKAAVLIL